MSYEDALEAMRERTVEPAPIERLRDKQSRTEILTKGIRATASAATAVAVLGFVVLLLHKTVRFGALLHEGNLTVHLAALLPMLVLLWSMRRIGEPRLGAQLSCRAVWWSNLVVGVLVSMNYALVLDRVAGVVIAIACAVALRSAGERGLDVQEADHPFAPVRFRGHLLLALVMAAADALTLAFSALLQLRFGAAGWELWSTVSYAGPTLIAALVMGVAVWGVYRLRTWALLLNLAANITIAYLAMEGTLNLSPTVSVALATTAAIQSFIPVPILAVALGDRNAGQPLISRVRARLMNGALYALVAVSIVGSVVGSEDGWVEGPGRTFVRGAGARRGVPPRERLDATGDDLRGRDFSDEVLTGAVFGGVDLRGASMQRAQLHGARFEDADLRGVDFRRADFFGIRVGDPTFEGTRLEGADFTGALASPPLKRRLLEGGLQGVRCPDGTPAHPDSGCRDHFGMTFRGFRQVFRLARTSTKGSLECGRVDDLTVMLGDDAEGFLWWRNERFVQLTDGSLVSPFTTIHISSDGRWQLSSKLCGDNELIPLSDEPSG